MNDKKAKREKITTTIVNIVFVVSLLSAIILPIPLVVASNNNVGIKGSPFCYMTPEFVVRLVCGAPDEIEEDILTPEKYLTYYNKKIFSHDATVTYTFDGLSGLIGVRAELTVPKGESETICNDIREKMCETYSKSESFFEEENGRFGRHNGSAGDFAWGTDEVAISFSDDKVIINAYVLM